MSIPKITGREARNLLEGTTPGPWEAGPSMTLSTTVAVFSHGYGPVALVSNREGGVDEVPALTDGALAAAAPELAGTVAWLCGREADLEREHYTNWYPTDRAEQWGVSVMKWKGNVLLGDNHSMQAAELTPVEAVDLARALLAAAEEARS